MQLNFIRLRIANNYEFRIYRKKGLEKEEGCKVYRLKNEHDIYESFNVSLDERDGFSLYNCDIHENRYLTKQIVFDTIIKHFDKSGVHVLESKGINKRQKICISIAKLSKGHETLTIEPYFLKEANSFGLLIDFSFRMNQNATFGLDIQKLSLSIDDRGKSNTRYYTDYHKKVSNAFRLLKGIELQTEELNFDNNFFELNEKRLEKRTYNFGRSNFDFSQFRGINKYQPFKKLTSTPFFVFVFNERVRLFAREVFLGLSGKSHTPTFGGMEKVFGVSMTKENVRFKILPSYEMQDLDKTVSEIEKEYDKDNCIVIYSQESRDEKTYYYLKMKFLEINFPFQVLTQDIIGRNNSLKWSLSNIGLQIFAKLGGIPWLVKPTLVNSLIIGIGQSYRKDEDGKILKYFSYSICLGTDGRYDRLEILGESNDEEEYLEALGQNLDALLKKEEYKSYLNIVLHIPYRINKKEINKIKSIVDENQDQSKFSIVRINEKNKFMGFSSHKTKIPYESSYLQLADNEFLMWFDGLQYGKELVYKRTSRPVYIEVMTKPDPVNFNDLLQDVINLSGANWRGFNAKQLPISIYYAQLISEYSRSFQTFEEFKETIFSDNKPWFL